MSEIIIADFGSQYTFKIAKTIRKLGYYCEIVDPRDLVYDDLLKSKIKVLILSGGPQSVYAGEGNELYASTNEEIGKVLLDSKVCVLGICFGLQYMCHYLPGGNVIPGKKGEYGKAFMNIEDESNRDPLISWMFNSKKSEKVNVKKRSRLKNSMKYSQPVGVWMSHQDIVSSLPNGFTKIGSTESCMYALVSNGDLNLYGMQFHPEVHHTFKGKHYIRSILQHTECTKNWNNSQKIDECKNYVSRIVPKDSKVILGLSGGVDSTVVAYLLRDVLPKDSLKCVLVDHGMMRLNEVEEVKHAMSDAGIELIVLDMSKLFMKHLAGVTDPEKKRKIIGHLFVESFEDYISVTTRTQEEFNVNWMLAQGTIYPDVVESAKTKHSSNQHLIKSHHNVGGLPEKMGLKLVEPLRNLFKNEVREIGNKLGVPKGILERHPFPGPGLGIRIIGEITEQKISVVQRADYIFIKELRANGLYDKTSQAYAALLSCKAVGVVGDQRRYGWIVCLRAVETKDFMTATAFHFHGSFLEDVSTKIINSIPEVSRVMYDTTNKPPGTIELE